MIQTKELFHLKALISERKTRESSFAKISLEIWCITSFLISIPLAILGYVLVTWTGETYLFEILGLAYSIYFLGWILAPLSGRKMSEFLDFSALIHMPVNRIKLFMISLATSLMDVAVLPIFPILWGVSIGLGVVYGWWWTPVAMAANFFFILTCLAFSQSAFLLHQIILRRTRWFPFMFGLLVPAAIFLGGAYIYLSVIMSLPLFDLFSRPELRFLNATFLLPSSAFILSLKGLFTTNVPGAIYHAGILAVEFAFILVVGAWLVQKVQRGESHKDLTRAGGKRFYMLFRKVLARIFRLSATMITLVEKDFKLVLREPETKTRSFFHVLFPIFLFCSIYIVAFVAGELALMGQTSGSTDFLKSFESFPYNPEEILHFWPLFFCIGLFAVARELTINHFGMERLGFQQMLLLGVPPWKILFSKNLAILFFVLIPILCTYVVGIFFEIHSMLSLHSIWLYLIVGVVFLFIGGNFISIRFPMRVDSSLGASLHRDTFARMIGIYLLESANAMMIIFVSFPIFLECLQPLINQPGYFMPFASLEGLDLYSVFKVVLRVWGDHGLYTIYVLGAYFISLSICAHFFELRKEKILAELKQRES